MELFLFLFLDSMARILDGGKESVPASALCKAMEAKHGCNRITFAMIGASLTNQGLIHKDNAFNLTLTEKGWIAAREATEVLDAWEASERAKSLDNQNHELN